MRVSSSLFVTRVNDMLFCHKWLVSFRHSDKNTVLVVDKFNKSYSDLFDLSTWGHKAKISIMCLLWSQSLLSLDHSVVYYISYTKSQFILLTAPPPQKKKIIYTLIHPYTHAHGNRMNIFTLGSMDLRHLTLTQWDFFSPSVSIWPILAFGHVQLFHFPNICVVAGGYAKPCRTGPADTDCEYKTGPRSVVHIHRRIILTYVEVWPLKSKTKCTVCSL